MPKHLRINNNYTSTSLSQSPPSCGCMGVEGDVSRIVAATQGRQFPNHTMPPLPVLPDGKDVLWELQNVSLCYKLTYNSFWQKSPAMHLKTPFPAAPSVGAFMAWAPYDSTYLPLLCVIGMRNCTSA